MYTYNSSSVLKFALLHIMQIFLEDTKDYQDIRTITWNGQSV